MDIQVKDTSIECSFKRKLVLDTWMSIKDSRTELERQRHVFQALNQLLPYVENLITDDLEKRVNCLCTRFIALWKRYSRNRSRLMSNKNNQEWLDGIEVCVLSTCTAAGSQDTQHSAAKVSTSTEPHQHRKSFGECSKRSKRRSRFAELSKPDSSAINSLLDDSSRSSAAASPSFDTNEVLSLINETKLTQHQYILVKDFINEKLSNALSSYQKVLEAKKQCYPSQMSVMESSAEVELQYLLRRSLCYQKKC